MRTVLPSDHRRFSLSRKNQEEGFSLIELMVVVAVLGVLMGLILPTLSRARSRGQAVSCLSNLHQLTLACQVYVDEHNDALPNNYGSADTRRTIGQKKYLNWVNNVLNWELSSMNTNEALVLAGGLGLYVGGGARVFKCPTDHVLSALQKSHGWEERTRSFSMNAMLGDAGEFTASGNNVNNPHYKQYFRMTAVEEPSRIFAFIEEHPDSINDGYFLNLFEGDEWMDLPASYHGGGANLVFVDGHGEFRRWLNASTQPPARPNGARLPLLVPEQERADFYWLLYRTSAKRY